MPSPSLMNGGKEAALLDPLSVSAYPRGQWPLVVFHEILQDAWFLISEQMIETDLPRSC